MTAFYNEFDPYAAQWIRNLADAGHVAPGVVDDRSIEDLTAADLDGHTQAHFFAGIAVWSHALRLAGWPDDLPVWTGSCPCQPFSAAGAGLGFEDPRHLWPVWFRLIEQCRPPVVFGEQVASKAGLAWLDSVRADLEGAGYAFGAADLCAAGVGAPHIRQRLFFVAVANSGDERRHGFDVLLRPEATGRISSTVPQTAGGGGAGGVADSNGLAGGQGRAFDGRGDPRGDAESRTRPGGGVLPRGLGDTNDAGLEGHGRPVGLHGSEGRDAAERHGATSGFWGDAEWVYCRDGKWRPVEPGTFPLAHGAPARVGRLRASGNAISPQVAAEFIQAAVEALP